MIGKTAPVGGMKLWCDELMLMKSLYLQGYAVKSMLISAYDKA